MSAPKEPERKWQPELPFKKPTPHFNAAQYKVGRRPCDCDYAKRLSGPHREGCVWWQS